MTKARRHIFTTDFPGKMALSQARNRWVPNRQHKIECGPVTYPSIFILLLRNCNQMKSIRTLFV